MKKFFKKMIGVIIIISLIFLEKYLSSYQFVYKANWGIEIIEPKKRKRVYNMGVIDPIIFDILYYDEDQLNVIRDYSYFEDMRSLYVEKKIEYFKHYLNDEEQKLIDENFDYSVLENPDNKYAYIQAKDGKENYVLLVLDVENYILYDFTIC